MLEDAQISQLDTKQVELIDKERYPKASDLTVQLNDQEVGQDFSKLLPLKLYPPLTGQERGRKFLTAETCCYLRRWLRTGYPCYLELIHPDPRFISDVARDLYRTHQMDNRLNRRGPIIAFEVTITEKDLFSCDGSEMDRNIVATPLLLLMLDKTQPEEKGREALAKIGPTLHDKSKTGRAGHIHELVSLFAPQRATAIIIVKCASLNLGAQGRVIHRSDVREIAKAFAYRTSAVHKMVVFLESTRTAFSSLLCEFRKEDLNACTQASSTSMRTTRTPLGTYRYTR
ncbi:hypothetical protein F5Y17DRAFT_434479 [Xylariaceae sp. FL0594]|nr:hypothetical protein F5Y17DRAFT_434479 [Xylariaceae sp. FL0594]